MYVTDLIRTYGNRIVQCCAENDKSPTAQKVKAAAESLENGVPTAPKLGTLHDLKPEIKEHFDAETAGAIEALVMISETAVKNDIAADCLVLRQSLEKDMPERKLICDALHNVISNTITYENLF